ncbi:MAG: hypothetical protein ACYCST_00225 [Acidimicrobiales bacterium]
MRRRRILGTVVRRLGCWLTMRRLVGVLARSSLDGRWWLMGGVVIGLARTGHPLANDLQDIDVGYWEEDHQAMLDTVPLLVRARFVPMYLLSDNEGRTIMLRFRRDGVDIDFTCCRQQEATESWVTIHKGSCNSYLEVETGVRLQRKVPYRLSGVPVMAADDLGGYLDEQYPEWDALAGEFYGRRWDYLRDCPAIVRVTPWAGRYERWQYRASGRSGGIA